MNKENINQHNISSDDLKFMRSAMEKSYRELKPNIHIMVTTGLVSMLANIMIYFLKTHQLDRWIWPVMISIISALFLYAVISLVRIAKNERRVGFISNIKTQVAGVWIFIILHGLAWTVLAMLFKNFSGGDPAFIWAMLFSIGLCVLGFFHSKEWFFGAILIFAGMVLTYFVEESAYIILGLTMGAGFIIPAIIVQRNYNRQEKENAEV